ncbi:endo alpha-1,4 polygalactosaminidase [Cryobacterium sp. 1639]|uniref:endo alpha-1,4 polygalactosaminidase n=1 Tax=Cryobacterium inferilacus TaxID=2866629 RepID=UPI001C7368BE|nr:endo alpha-1,4 polygalactosaminidase [Cryobacterium sp. 1639]MBX0299328.1 endo alpha-1,4 polygalactosaminidase [Cryobacterium sp. 1639]
MITPLITRRRVSALGRPRPGDRFHRRALVAALLPVLLVAGALTGCTTTAAPSTDAPLAGAVTLPPAGAGFDYQLGGAYDPPAGIRTVVRDSTADAVAGLYSICYLNGFQTQPAESERLWADSPELILTAGTEPVQDENWPDEYLFDTGSADSRAGIEALLRPQIEGCAAAGFDAVEIDNLDSYTRSAGLLDAADNIALARLFVATAHEAGLAIGQKNTADLAAELAGDFDFAVTEECDRWQECGLYTAAYGDHVLAIEYADDLREDFAAACAVPDRPRSMILRDRDLVTPGTAGYRYRSC